MQSFSYSFFSILQCEIHGRVEIFAKSIKKVDPWLFMSKPSEGGAKERQQINGADGWKGTKKECEEGQSYTFIEAVRSQQVCYLMKMN